MGSKETPRPPDDENTARLREALRNRRRVTLSGVVILLAILLIPVAAFVLFFQPGDPAAPLIALTFDALTTRGADAQLVAQVLAADAEGPLPRLGGRELFFEAATSRQQDSPQRVTARTNASGTLGASWKTDEKISDFLLRWPDGRIADQARVFTFAPETALVLVDVESTLAGADAETWKKENILDIAAVNGTSPVLREIAAKDREIVYLAFGSDEPLVQRKVRGWMENRFAEGWPVGPVLSRKNFEPASDYRKALTSLQKSFTGPVSFIVGDAELAKHASELGFRTFVLHAADIPAGCIGVKDWPDIAAHFAVKEN